MCASHSGSPRPILGRQEQPRSRARLLGPLAVAKRPARARLRSAGTQDRRRRRRPGRGPRRHLSERPARSAAKLFPAFFHNDFLKLLTRIVPHFSSALPTPRRPPPGFRAPGRSARPARTAPPTGRAPGLRSAPPRASAQPPAANRPERAPAARAPQTLGLRAKPVLARPAPPPPPPPPRTPRTLRHRAGQEPGGGRDAERGSERDGDGSWGGTRKRARRGTRSGARSGTRSRARRLCRRSPARAAPSRPQLRGRARKLCRRAGWDAGPPEPRLSGRQRARAVPAGAAAGCSPLACAGPAGRAAATPAPARPSPPRAAALPHSSAASRRGPARPAVTAFPRPGLAGVSATAPRGPRLTLGGPARTTRAGPLKPGRPPGDPQPCAPDHSSGHPRARPPGALGVP